MIFIEGNEVLILTTIIIVDLKLNRGEKIRYLFPQGSPAPSDVYVK